MPKKDSELTRPIFLRLLADLRPKRVIAMSARIASELESILLEPKKKLVDNGRRKIELIKSSLPEEYGGGRFMYIPHPNSPVLKQARDEAWKFAFE